MSAKRRTLAVDPQRWTRLEAIAQARNVHVNDLVQEGVAAVLDLAEKQQDTLERVIAKTGQGGTS